MKSGIYSIINLVNDKIYVGQSIDIKRRLRNHKNDLKKNRHDNFKLQNSFNKHGLSCFKFDILEYCLPESLTEREQFWINKFNKNLLYNIVLDVCSATITKDLSLKMSLSQKGKRNHNGILNPNYGNKLNNEQKKCMALSSSKLNEKKVLEIKRYLLDGKLSSKEIAEIFGISSATVNKICNGSRWASVTGGRVIFHKRYGLHNIGKKKPPHVIESIRKSNLGRKQSEATKQKIKQAMLGKKLSEETKQKLREASYGKKHSEETKKKMRESHLKIKKQNNII